MKHRISARNRYQRRSSHLTPKRTAIFVLVALMAFSVISPLLQNDTTVNAATDYDAKIKALESEISGYNARAKELSDQSDSLSNAIATLQNEQNQLQAEIDLNNTKLKDLKVKITENEAKIKSQGTVLSQTLADMHFDQQTSPIEMLASSKNLSEYVDKEARQSAVQEELNTSIQKINSLKKELEAKKTQVEGIIADQNGRSAELSSKKSEQQNLLSDTQGQEDKYASMTAENKKKIAELEAQQAEDNRTGTGGGSVIAGDPNRGGYPSYLYNARKDSLIDRWGMYNRECVSYTAWKVYQTYGSMPYWGGRGHAKQWDDNARAAGIPTGTTPKKGAVAVWHTGRWGHVAWVESVNSNGTFNLSEMNRDSDGNYHERSNVSTGGVVFIYFGDR